MHADVVDDDCDAGVGVILMSVMMVLMLVVMCW